MEKKWHFGHSCRDEQQIIDGLEEEMWSRLFQDRKRKNRPFLPGPIRLIVFLFYDFLCITITFTFTILTKLTIATYLHKPVNGAAVNHWRKHTTSGPEGIAHRTHTQHNVQLLQEMKYWNTWGQRIDIQRFHNFMKFSLSRHVTLKVFFKASSGALTLTALSWA